MKKFRKAIAVLLAVLLCISAVPATVWGEAAQTTQEQVMEDVLKIEQGEEQLVDIKKNEETARENLLTSNEIDENKILNFIKGYDGMQENRYFTENQVTVETMVMTAAQQLYKTDDCKWDEKYLNHVEKNIFEKNIKDYFGKEINPETVGQIENNFVTYRDGFYSWPGSGFRNRYDQEIKKIEMLNERQLKVDVQESEMIMGESNGKKQNTVFILEKNENSLWKYNLNACFTINTSFAGGDGSIENPYQIATAEQLDAVRNDLTASYVLINDIDLSGFENWEPIGEYSYNDETVQFRGNFNGNNYKISNLKIIHDNVNAGLFGSIYDTYSIQIKNIFIENANIKGNFKYAGVLCGVINRDFTNAESTVSVENCTVSGEINGINTTMIGGLIGYAGQSKILNCKNYVNISGQGENICAGGIVGGSDYQQTIQNCVNFGNIYYESNGSIHIGGVAGNGYEIERSYNKGNLTAIQSETANLSDFLFGGIQGGFGSFGPDGNVSNRYYSLVNCQNAAEEINAFQRKDNLELVPLDNIAFRIINSSVGERMKINNNISWSKTKINSNVVPDNDPEVGPDKKHGKSVEASALDESIRPSDPEVPVVKELFQMERDNFKFSNAPQYFTKNYWTKYINKIKDKMDNSVNVDIDEKMNEKWGGSCYGMCAVAALNKYENRLNFSNYQKDARVPYDLDDPNKNEEVLSLINYYYLTQLLPDHDTLEENQKKSFKKDQTYFAQKIVEAAKKAEDSGIPSILEYNWWEKNGKLLNGEEINKNPNNVIEYAHAVLICGIEDDNNDLFKVKIYDPNVKRKTQSLTVSSNYRMINYYTTDGLFPRTFKFNINAGDNDKDTNNKNTNFMPYCITSGLDQIDLINIEERDCNITRTKKDQATLTVPQSKAFSLTNSDGITYKMGEEGPLSLLNGKVDSDTEEEKSKISFVLDDMDSYTFTPETKEDLNVVFTLGDAYMEVYGDKIESSVFDSSGKISLKGNDIKYNLALTLNKNLQFLPWYTIGVQGGNSNNVSLERAENGVLLSADKLEKIIITGSNEKENKTLPVSLDKNKALITKHDSNLAVYSDEDNDGNYETLVAETDTTPVSGVTLDQTKTKVEIGRSIKLTPTITPDNATEKAVTWSSSDNNIATVDENGLVTAISEGKATVTVTTKDGNKTATCEVTVTKKEDSGNLGEPTNPTAPTVKPNDGQGTTAAGQLKPDTTNNGANPLTGMTFQEKMNTMAIWLAAAALCAAAIFMVKRRIEK